MTQPTLSVAVKTLEDGFSDRVIETEGRPLGGSLTPSNVRKYPYHLNLSGRSAMPVIHEVATLTSKGQITLPKPIRQALGVTFGGKVAFDLQGSQVVVSRADDALHEDPAIESFLALLESDIRSGQRVCNLPDDVVRAMQATLERPVDLAADIDGDVAL